MPEHADPTLPKVALITGAAQRIGRAMALSLAERGWAVALHYRSSADAAARLADQIVASGGHACTLRADLSNEAETADLVPQARARLGPLGLLVNNAAHFQRDTVDTASRASWDAHLETNLRAPFLLMQQFAKHHAPESQTNPHGLPIPHGLIVNLLDQWVWNPPADFVSYTLSKTGLWCLTQTMAMALAPTIRVNAIGPGPTLRNQRQSQAHFDALVARSPLAKAATPDDICQALHYFIEAPAVTGEMIALDGGQHLV